MDLTEANEHVKAATDALTHCGHPKYLENPVTDEEKAFLRDLFAAEIIALKPAADALNPSSTAPPELPASSDILESMREAQREVESWKPWQRAAMGIPEQPAQATEVERVKRAFISACCELPEKHIDADTMRRFMDVSDRVSRSLKAALAILQSATKEEGAKCS